MWWMWLLGLAFVALPLVLMVVFHRDDLADSRGRRVQHTWRVHAKPHGKWKP